MLQGFFIAGTYAADLPLALFVTLNFFGGVAQLAAYRRPDCPFLAFGWILTGAPWAIVAVVAMINRGELARSPNPSRAARAAA